MKYLGIFLTLLLPFLVEGQAMPIFLNNASFEDTPGHSKPPWGWFFCGPHLASPPDVHPSGMYGVEEQAKEGRTYVGMVVRDVNTWETIGQRLGTPLRAEQCYAFSIWLALPQQYLSISRLTGQAIDYTQPAVLRIWGGQLHCDKSELLATSEPIYHHDWKEYRFVLKPTASYPVLTLEAFYDPKQLHPYCGSILVDHASALLPIDCESGAYQFRLEKLQVSPSDRAQIEEFVRSNNELIRLNPGNRSLEEQIYLTNNGLLLQGNIYFHSIILCLHQFPGAMVVIHLPYYNAIQYKKCREYIIDQLHQWSVLESQWKIKRKKTQGVGDNQIQIEFIYKE